jgi:hypothetical protein
MAEKTIKAPVTVFYKGQYVAPGTEITLDEAEANKLIGQHGEFGGSAPLDPGSTQGKIDAASIDALNTYASINKGHGPLPDDMSKLSRAELEAEAAKRGVDVPENTSDAKLIKLIKAKAAG